MTTSISRMVSRWLDIDSTHRLRALNPNPCDFTIPIQVADASLINDPVLSSSPWTMSLNGIGANYTQTSADAQHITLDPSEPAIHDAYINCTLEVGGEDHSITEYDGDTQVATVDTAFSFIPAPNTPYLIRQVQSFFDTRVAIGAPDPRTQTVSSVNLISASPSQTAGLYNSDLFSFTNSTHGLSNSQVVTSYTPQPNNAAFSQPHHEGAFQWCPLTPQGVVFTSRTTGTLDTFTISVRCINSSSLSRLMQVRLWTHTGATLLSSTLLSVSPSTAFHDLTYTISAAQLQAGQPYRLTLQDLTAGGNSNGWIEWSGVPSGLSSSSPDVFSVVPRYSLIVVGVGGVSEYVYQQPTSDAATDWVQAGGNQAFVFTTPGDTNTMFSAMTGSAIFVAFDGNNAQRTISTSLYRGNLLQQGTVANPDASQLVYTAITTLDVSNNAYSYAPVSINGEQQLLPNQTSLNIGGTGTTTGAGSVFNVTQNVVVSPPTTWTAQAGQSNVWHIEPNTVVLSTGTGTYGHYSSGFSTPANLQNDAQQVQVVVAGHINGTSYAPTLTFQAWWNDPGLYQVILNPMSVVAVLGASTDGGATSPYTATFTYTRAESSNVQFSQRVDLIVGYTYDTGAGTSTFSHNSVSWSLTYPAAASGGAVPIQGGSTYTFVWNDETPGGNDTGFTMFLGADAQSTGLATDCDTAVYPWFNFTDATTSQQWFGQSLSDPWALQGMMPDGHEIGYWFQPSDTLPLLSVAITLLCFAENAGQRYLQARLRAGNSDDLSGAILESIPVLLVVSQGMGPTSITFNFSGNTLLNAGQNYTFSLTDATGDANHTGGVYVYGVLDDQTALGWDQGGLAQWSHPWVSAQMSVFCGQLVFEPASQQLNQDLTGLYTLDTATSLVMPFTVSLGDEGYVTAFSFLGSAFGDRTVQVSLYGPTVSQLLYQGTIVLPDGGLSAFSTETGREGRYALGDQVPELQVVNSVGTYYFVLLDVTASDNSSTSGVFMYGLGGPLPNPQMDVIVPVYTLSYGPPQPLSSFVGGFQDVIEFSPSTSDNLSVLHVGGTLVSSTGKTLNSGWFYVVLDWVIIPKQLMSVGIGGLLSNYPFMYVVLTNVGGMAAQRMIHSNNRNLPPTASFLVEISTWLYNADPKQFFTMTPAGADTRPQLMQLRLDLPLSLQLVLPNGQVIAFETLDNQSPSPVNPLVQISASFRVTPV